MGWLIKIDTIEYTDAVFDHIEENLNGHIEAAFTLPNNETNRTLVNADHTVEILYNDGAATTSEFTGILRAPEFQQSGLLCKCYQTCYEQMQRKVHTGNYDAITPDVILAAIASSAGVLVGACPTTPTLSVRYDKAYCFDGARFIAWVLGKDLYPDFSGASPRINIGTAGTGYPSGRGLLQYTTVPKRGKDRAKKRDKVYIRGLDASGLPLVGEAGTGTEVAVFTDRTATNQATINALAAKKLADLNVEASGCIVPTTLESPIVAPAYVQGYDIHAGDYVILNCAELDYSSSVVRVIKVTKRLIDTAVEVEKAELLLDDYLEEIEQWESLGIFAPVTAPDIDPVTPSEFGTDDVVPVSIQNADGTFVTLFAVTVHRVTGMSGYKVRWHKQGETVWNYVDIEQPASGDAVLYTAPVAMGSTYDLQVASFNMDEKVSAYTTSVAKVATTDTSAPAVPSGVTAITSGLVRSIKVSWTAVTSADLKGYKVYRHTSNVPGSATEIAKTSANVIIVDSNIVTPYYFWVSSYDFIGNESAKSALATGCPVTGQKEVITDVTDVTPEVPVITCLAQEVDTSDEFRTWIQVTITRVTDAGGYVVSYKRTVDTQWTHYYVEQPSSGNPIAVTPSLNANTSYDVHACSVSQKGQASAWSTTQTIVTTVNTTAPPVPTGLVATAIVDGVLLEWNPAVATDLSHYRVYYGTTNPPLTVAGQISRPFYAWHKKTTETYVLYYFAITAVDDVGNESAKCTAVSATPTQIVNLDIAPNAVEADKILAGAVTEAKIADDNITATKLKSGVQPFNSDITFTPTTGSEHDSITFTTGTIRFADGGTQAITGANLSLAAATGIWYIYFTVGSAALSATQTYSLAQSDTKGLLALCRHSTDATQQIMIFPFYAKGLNINADIIAANAIVANAIKADAVEADKIKAGAVTADKLTVAAIYLTGLVLTDNSPSAGYVAWSACTLYYEGVAYAIAAGNTNLAYIYWTKPNTAFTVSATKPAWVANRYMIIFNSSGAAILLWNATYIHGGTLITGTITSQDIKTDNLEASVIKAGTITGTEADRILADGSVKTAKILSLNADKVLIDGAVYLSNWRKGGDLTKIDGGVISTGTILAASIAASQILISKLATETLDRMYDTSALSDAIQGWPHASDATKIDGGDIYTGSVHTAQILFDILASDPTYVAGKLWCKDVAGDPQLRFSKGTSLSDVFIIPKYPLYDAQAPPENMVPNQGFEYDRDGDGMPDFWTKSYEAGNPAYAWSTAYSWKGQHSLKLGSAPGRYIVFDCIWIPVLPNKKYFFSVDIYADVPATFEYGVAVVEFWNAAKSYPNVGAIGLPASVAAGWNHLSVEGTTSSTARWALIKLYNYGPNVVVDLYFDNIVLSEMRAAVPTAGTVVGGTYGTASQTLTSGAWNTVSSVTVPSSAHEILFFWVNLSCLDNPAYAGYLRCKLKLTKAGESDEYYPSNTDAQCPKYIVRGSKWDNSFMWTITVPKDRQGWSAVVQIYMYNTNSSSIAVEEEAGVWGHSPHTHR